jgi:ProP effector
MTKITLKLPLEIREKLAKLKKAPDPVADKSVITRRRGKNPVRLPGKPAADTLPPIDRENRKKARERFLAAKTWLEDTFPKAFNFKDPKPLKLNIEQDIFRVESPFSRRLIRKVIACYVRTTAYLKSIAREDGRYDLQGERAGEVRQVEKDHALQQLKQRKTFWKQKRKRRRSQGVKETEGEGQHGLATSATIKA